MNWLILDAVYLWRKQYTNKPGLYWVYGTILITSSALLHSYLSVRSNPFIVYQETGSGIFSVLYINGFIRGLYHLALSFVAFDIGQQEHYVYSIVWLVIAAGLIVFAQSSNKTLINKVGTSFHCNDWEQNFDLGNKTVAIIGSFASAVQIISAIVNKVKKLHLVQRIPHWILPRPDWTIPILLRKLFALGPIYTLIRGLTYWLLELRVIAFNWL
jgi:hypothetical protein